MIVWNMNILTLPCGGSKPGCLSTRRNLISRKRDACAILRLLMIAFLFFVIPSRDVNGQTSKVFVSDISNYWLAFDSVKATSNKTDQLGFIQSLYLDKATPGLKEFIALRPQTAQQHLNNMITKPKFWNSVRPLTLRVEQQVAQIDQMMNRFAANYKQFDRPSIYFLIGILNTGGTTNSTNILIGSEIACADRTVDASELGSWLQKVFQTNQDIIYLTTHEAVHTQQESGDDVEPNLLGFSLKEGSCDFIAEILMESKIPMPYMQYGIANEKDLWPLFEKEMLGDKMDNWLHNGDKAPAGQADLGYFMGYSICKAYYQNARNKSKAFKRIIELKFDKKHALRFLKHSGYAAKMEAGKK